MKCQLSVTLFTPVFCVVMLPLHSLQLLLGFSLMILLSIITAIAVPVLLIIDSASVSSGFYFSKRKSIIKNFPRATVGITWVIIVVSAFPYWNCCCPMTCQSEKLNVSTQTLWGMLILHWSCLLSSLTNLVLLLASLIWVPHWNCCCPHYSLSPLSRLWLWFCRKDYVFIAITVFTVGGYGKAIQTSAYWA